MFIFLSFAAYQVLQQGTFCYGRLSKSKESLPTLKTQCLKSLLFKHTWRKYTDISSASLLFLYPLSPSLYFFLYPLFLSISPYNLLCLLTCLSFFLGSTLTRFHFSYEVITVLFVPFERHEPDKLHQYEHKLLIHFNQQYF